MDSVRSCLVVDWVVERKVVKHGLLAFFDLVQVGIDGPVSRIWPGKTASRWAVIGATVDWAGGGSESRLRQSPLGIVQESDRAESRGEPRRRQHGFPSGPKALDGNNANTKEWREGGQKRTTSMGVPSRPRHGDAAIILVPPTLSPTAVLGSISTQSITCR